MRNGVGHLSATIAAHLREWEPATAFVELAIFATDDPPAIAQMLASFCLKVLGAPVRRALFHQSSIGSVTGIELADDRAVGVKAHQPERSHGLLSEIVRIQSYLSKNGIFAPPVLAGPVVLGRGLAIVEQFCGAGITADAHDAGVRRALAAGLFRVVKACDFFVSSTSLEPALLGATGGALWPKPHSKLFDFAATARGAEWIDEVAGLARERVMPAGRHVIGHGDWRQEHVRFVGGDIMLAFDWDSLCYQPEPMLSVATRTDFARIGRARTARKLRPCRRRARSSATTKTRAARGSHRRKTACVGRPSRMRVHIRRVAGTRVGRTSALFPAHSSIWYGTSVNAC